MSLNVNYTYTFSIINSEQLHKWTNNMFGSIFMILPVTFIFEKRTKLVIADSSERKKWRAIGLRRLMRESKLTQAPVSNVLRGKPVRHRTLSIIRQAADRLVTKS